MPDEPDVVNFPWGIKNGCPMRGYAVGVNTKFTFWLGATNCSFPNVNVSCARTFGLRLTQGVAA